MSIERKVINVNELRWQCSGCGRFVAQAAIQERTYLDPGAYYGIGDEVWVDCERCGRAEPTLVVVGTRPLGGGHDGE